MVAEHIQACYLPRWFTQPDWYAHPEKESFKPSKLIVSATGESVANIGFFTELLISLLFPQTEYIFLDDWGD